MGEYVGLCIGNYEFLSCKNSFGDLLSKLPTTSSTGGLLSALIRAIITARPEGRCRKQCY